MCASHRCCLRWRQWVAYHHLLGIEHFYIYDNNSTDSDTLRLRLRPFMAAGLVTYVNWPFSPDEGMHWNQVQTRSKALTSGLAPAFLAVHSICCASLKPPILI